MKNETISRRIVDFIHDLLGILGGRVAEWSGTPAIPRIPRSCRLAVSIPVAARTRDPPYHCIGASMNVGTICETVNGRRTRNKRDDGRKLAT